MEIKVGKVYKVTHQDMGVFYLKVDSTDEDHVNGTITDETDEDESGYDSGTRVSVRKELCAFELE